jgi:predicted ester cyclase
MLDQILAPEWVDIPPPPGVPSEPAGAKRTLAMLTTTFPDLRIIVEDIVQDGGKVVVRSTISGTQRANFMGAQGRRLSNQAVDIHEFKDGKIIRTWHTEDWMTGLNQLGAFEH